MLVKDDRLSNDILDILPSSQIVDHLLKTRQYDELEELLDHAQTSIGLFDQPHLDDMLAAARQICLACKVLQDEAKWHRWAAGEADHREQVLMHSLQMISDLINGELENCHARPEILTLSAVPPSLSSGENSLNGDGHNLWQRLQNILKSEKYCPPDDVAWRSTLPQVESAPEIEEIFPITQAVETTSTYETGEVSNNTQQAEVDSPDREEPQRLPSLIIYGLGAFQVYLNDQLVENWPNRKAKSVFKYLILQRTRPVPKEVLMECFWPDSDIEAARNNLNVTIYNLRQALRKDGDACSYILFHDDCYLLNPDLDIWVDFEEFIEHFNKGQQLEWTGELTQAIHEYGAAESLYQGQLFEEDRYEDWPISQRQNLQDTYLLLLDRLSTYYLDTGVYTACVSVCNKMLAVDSCREDVHRRLMICYSEQGQRYLALRQYHICVEAHKKELEALPCPETLELYEKICTNQLL